MGSYLEKNMQAFTDMQSRMLDPAKALYDPKQLSPETWSQFVNGQNPAVSVSAPPAAVATPMAGCPAVIPSVVPPRYPPVAPITSYLSTKVVDSAVVAEASSRKAATHGEMRNERKRLP